MHVILQIAKGVDVAVPMQIDEIDRTPGAIAHELMQPFEAASVRDRGRAQPGLPGERLHVRFVRGHGGVDGHACCSGVGDAEIGLVEGHQSICAFVQGGLRCGRPCGEEGRVVAEEEWDESHGGVGDVFGVAVS